MKANMQRSYGLSKGDRLLNHLQNVLALTLYTHSYHTQTQSNRIRTQNMTTKLLSMTVMDRMKGYTVLLIVHCTL